MLKTRFARIKYSLSSNKENEHFWIIKNTSYPEYDDRGKGKFYSKQEVEEKFENYDWIKL